MTTDELLQQLRYGNQLKRTARTGWVMRGVVGAENVAAHSFGMAYTALLLAQQMPKQAWDMGRLLAMCLLHDLPEAWTTDIPVPAWRHLPSGTKETVERGVAEQMLPQPALRELWDELVANETAEAKLVHDADKLDLFLQARMYEDQQGNRQLAEFWRKPYVFHYKLAQEIYDQLRAEREANEA